MQIGAVNSEEPGRTKLIKSFITSPRCALGWGGMSRALASWGRGARLGLCLSLPAPTTSCLCSRGTWQMEPEPFQEWKGKDFRILIDPDAAIMERL